MATPWLADAEIDDLCAPLTQPAAQVRYLRQVLKLQVSTKPNGRALVIRSHAEAVLSGSKADAGGASSEGAKPEVLQQQPNRDALILRFGRKGARSNGQAEEEQSA